MKQKNLSIKFQINECFGLSFLWDKNIIGLMIGCFIISFEKGE